MNEITGTVRPIHDNVLVCCLNFDERVSKGGIVFLSDNGKPEGVRPRWAKVWAVGPEQHDVEVGDWILIEHGRWTRKFVVNGEEIHGVDVNGILMVSDSEIPE